MKDQVGVRGRRWFQALTGMTRLRAATPAPYWRRRHHWDRARRFSLCGAESREPLSMRSGWTGRTRRSLCTCSYIRALIAEDEDKPKEEKRPIVAIVDVKSQAYGRREETVGIFLAAATAADAYATARMKGHP